MARTAWYAFSTWDLPAHFQWRAPFIKMSRRCSFVTVVLSEEKLSEFEESTSVLYVGGLVDGQLTLVRTVP